MNRKKINAKMVDMNNIIKQLDQQTSIEYSSQEQNTFFSSVHGTFSRINHMLLLSHFSYVRLCATPQTAAHQAPLSLDSPGKNTGVGCHFPLQCLRRCSVMSNSVRPHRWQPNRLPRPWDFPGKSTGVGCHCLLRVKPSTLSYISLNLFIITFQKSV